MSRSRQLVVFMLQELRYALHLEAVERVLLAVEVTPLPRAPEMVMGVFNLQGRIVPVLDVRRRFRLPAATVSLSYQLLLARTSRRRVALLVDSVAGVREGRQEDITPAPAIHPGLEHLQGVLCLEDGLILIHDLETFLSIPEETSLDRAMQDIREVP